MKKILVVGNTPWTQVLDMMLKKFAPDVEVKVVNCEYRGDAFYNNGTWSKDPLDSFLELEPDCVFIHYEPAKEQEACWWKPWKEMVSVATPAQKIYRFGWMQLDRIRWVAEGSSVRERASGEALTDCFRLPISSEDFKKLLTQ